MPIYFEELDKKLAAIQAKDLDDIIAKGTYLPFMGKSYTKTDLQMWLQKRIDLLSNARNYTDNQIQSALNSTYNSLSKEDKLIADKILAGEDYSDWNPTTANSYENLVVIILYKFVTTP